MGADAYWYFMEYDADFEAALQKLRQREFQAGRYRPVAFVKFPVDLAKPSPGARHPSIEAAREAADTDGTRSILDIEHVGEESNIGIATLLDNNRLESLFETTKPTHKMVEGNMDVFYQIGRGEAVCIVVYQDGQPDELYFAGLSYD